LFKRKGDAPIDTTPGESGVDVSISSISNQSFVIYNINIRCFFAHTAELCHHIALHSPHVIFIQESWLNESIEQVELPNYTILSRRDRSSSENRGGIIAFVRLDVKNVVHVNNSTVAERSWHLLHSDIGSIALCNWYRPPGADLDHIDSFQQELSEFQDDAIGSLVIGDLNIHHMRWLRFSNDNTAAGAQLKRICDEADLHQLVREPTREQYLLDLCLSDVDGAKVEVLPKIADHKALLVTLRCSSSKHQLAERQVWHFKGAAWQNLRCELKCFDWTLLQRGTVNEAVDLFMDVLTSLYETYIPQSVAHVQKQSHPWLDDKCSQAIRAKNLAEGSDSYERLRDQCAAAIKGSYQSYVTRLKGEIQKLPKGSKRWWALNRQLLSKKSRVTSIPPLKNAANE